MNQTDPTSAIEVWARMLCSADVHVYGADHPTWQQLTGSRVQDDYRKAAAWLLPRMTVAPKPAAVSPPADRAAAPADWIDGHPQLEAIAAAVWERCETRVGGIVYDDPRNIAVAALAAVLPAPTALSDAERTMLAYALDQAQERIWSEGGFTDEDQAAVTSLRRLAGEARQDEPDVCRSVEVDGETIRVRGAGQFTEQERGFAEEIVRAAKRKYAAEHPDVAWQDPAPDGTQACGTPGHRAHPGFTCAEVDQTRPFWEGRWADDTTARSGQPETDDKAQP